MLLSVYSCSFKVHNEISNRVWVRNKPCTSLDQWEQKILCRIFLKTIYRLLQNESLSIITYHLKCVVVSVFAETLRPLPVFPYFLIIFVVFGAILGIILEKYSWLLSLIHRESHLVHLWMMCNQQILHNKPLRIKSASLGPRGCGLVKSQLTVVSRDSDLDSYILLKSNLTPPEHPVFAGLQWFEHTVIHI